MKIKASAALVGKTAPQVLDVKPVKKDFKGVLELQKQQISPKDMPNVDLFKDIQNIQKAILSGKEFSGKDLILYQIKTGQYGMRVELISKVAESAVSTVKKFQNPQ